MQVNPIICAIDTSDLDHANELVKSLAGKVGAIKLGLEFFVSHGPQAVKQFQAYDLPIFLDLKLHDIPNTVAKAIKGAVALDVFMITIHTIGGRDMMEAAAKIAKETAKSLNKTPPIIVGVTVLTSMDKSDLEEVGVVPNITHQVVHLATLAKEAGLDGVVCSPHEITAIRQACGNDFCLVVPGIRPKTSQNNDQKRIMTPEEALNLGANYLVIGRPITASENPTQAAENLYTALNSK